MTTRRRVLLACCNGRGWIHKLVVRQALRMLQDHRHTVTFIMPTWKPFVQNLHKTVLEFLDQGHDFLLLMDDDNPPLHNPLDLVELDLDVVGLPTPIASMTNDGDRPYYLNALKEVLDKDGSLKGFVPLDANPEFVPKGLHEADAVGTGCILIARRVLLELMKRARGKPWDTPFMRTWNDRGEVILGNDYAFCVRARSAGFRIFAHFDYCCQHFNELELREVISSFHRFENRVEGK